MASYSVSLLAIVWLSGIKVNDLVNELSIEPILNVSKNFFENMPFSLRSCSIMRHFIFSLDFILAGLTEGFSFLHDD